MSSYALEVIGIRNVGAVGAAAELLVRSRFSCNPRTANGIDASPVTREERNIEQPGAMFSRIFER
ncbi:uncharacterized protein METZ01_LOCUS21492 [marine metagenome]|uniref:Uncharacterized protein n=1 Tax=marine metagenome TaxID=408172 RepID=A0A381PQA3_9ZZZZ